MVAYDPHYSHLQSADRRESTASATSSLGSFESASTLTSDVGDNAIMTRLRKSFEQKEEFLRRGVTQSQEPSAIKTGNAQSTVPNAMHPDGTGDNGKRLSWFPSPLRSETLFLVLINRIFCISFLGNQRHNREFYARPNRLQKPIWPPPEFESKRLSSVKESVTNENLRTNKLDDGDANDTVNLKLINDPQPTVMNATDSIMPLQPKSTNTLPPHRLANHLAREQFYNGTKEIVVTPQLHVTTTQTNVLNQQAIDADDNLRFNQQFNNSIIGV